MVISHDDWLASRQFLLYATVLCVILIIIGVIPQRVVAVSKERSRSRQCAACRWWQYISQVSQVVIDGIGVNIGAAQNIPVEDLMSEDIREHVGDTHVLVLYRRDVQFSRLVVA